MERLITEVRRKHPGLAKKELTSPLSAIRLFCLECVGGSSREVEDCTDKLCPLFVYRFGKGTQNLTPEERQRRSDRARALRKTHVTAPGISSQEPRRDTPPTQGTK